MREVKAGDIIGEIGVLCYRPQLFTVRTKRLCQLLRMNRTTFLNIIQANVGDGTIIMNNLLQVNKQILLRFSNIENRKVSMNYYLLVLTLFLCGEQHLKEMNDPVMTNVLLEIENMLARGKMDLPLNLCFAAIREDDLLLHQLLKRGLDPNESDNNGRTPLVSQVHILVLLFSSHPSSWRL